MLEPAAKVDQDDDRQHGRRAGHGDALPAGLASRHNRLARLREANAV